MMGCWKRLNYFTRTQVFLRVMPVVFLTVLAVGIFSLVVFATAITENAIHHRFQELAGFIENVRHQVSLEAMSLEYWKQETWDEPQAEAGLPRSSSGEVGVAWVENWARFDFVGVVALVSSGDAVPDLEVIFSFADSLENSANRRILDAWIQDHRILLGEEFELDRWARAHASISPVQAEGDFSHSIYMFPPVLVQVAEKGSLRSSRASRQALLPVLVRENFIRKNSRLEGRKHGSSKAEDGWREKKTHGVFFMDLGALVGEIPLNDWWCILGDDGLVMGSRSGLPFAGTKLKNQPKLDEVEVFGAMSGADLASWMDSSWQGTEHRLVGWRKLPWLVTASRAQDLPMTILTACPVGHLRRTLSR